MVCLDRSQPRYPIYIPSRGRPDAALTAALLERDEVPYFLCVAPFEVHDYQQRHGDHVLSLPRDDMDIVAVRNWIRDCAEASGAEKHWQLDDNIRTFFRRYKAKRLPCHTGVALRVCEDFCDRYSNVALAGFNYEMFCPDYQMYPPFVINCKIYSCTLVNHEMPYRWRGPYNDDTDLCLQALAGGWCTVSLNAFLQDKATTLTMKGGMTDSNENNYRDDGRLKMARTLERRWPGVVQTRRRFQRPQHYVNGSWKKFDTPLKLKEGLSLSDFQEVDEYGMKLDRKREPKSRYIKSLADEYEKSHQ